MQIKERENYKWSLTLTITMEPYLQWKLFIRLIILDSVFTNNMERDVIK